MNEVGQWRRERIRGTLESYVVRGKANVDSIVKTVRTIASKDQEPVNLTQMMQKIYEMSVAGVREYPFARADDRKSRWLALAHRLGINTTIDADRRA